MDTYDDEDERPAVNPFYERHDGLGIIQDQHVAIIGCGGIGSWIALYLGLAGVKAIDIYDSDSISENNLNRFPLGPDKIGVNKAIAMAEHIQYLRQDVSVTPRQNFEPEIHFEKLATYDWVIVTTDSLKSRRMVYDNVVKAGRDRGYHLGYIEAGADGHHATITFSPASFATKDEENPGYRTVPVFVGPCAMAASVVSYYVLLGIPRDYQRTVRFDWADDMGGLEGDWHSRRLRVADINEADEPLIDDDRTSQQYDDGETDAVAEDDDRLAAADGLMGEEATNEQEV